MKKHIFFLKPLWCSQTLWTLDNKYTESYNIFACSGILFNHESPLRGETFVTKKVVVAAVKYFKNKKEILEIGNLNAVRD